MALNMVAWKLGFLLDQLFCFSFMVVVLLRFTSSQDADVFCGNVGQMNVNSNFNLTANQEHRFYLDVNNPAVCNGVVTIWEYCFYVPQGDQDSYTARFAVYRPNNAQSVYERVSPAFSIAETPRNSLRQSLGCNRIELDNVTVQEGDVIGACITDPNGSGRLDLVSNSRDDNTFGLLAMSDSECVSLSRLNRLPSIVEVDQFNNVDGVILHLTAAIEGPMNQPTTTETIFHTESIPPPTDSSSDTPVPEASGLDAGAIAGIIVVLLVLIAGVSLTVVPVIILVWRKKNSKCVNSTKRKKHVQLTSTLEEVSQITIATFESEHDQNNGIKLSNSCVKSEIEMSPNEAYIQHDPQPDENISLQRNDAYATSALTSPNIAYKQHKARIAHNSDNDEHYYDYIY